MSSTADTYRTLAERFTAVVEAVPADAWGRPSPCADWTAREVLIHVVDAERQAVTPAKLELRPGPSSTEDPLAAWADVRDQLQQLLDDPERAGTSFDGFFGPITVAKSIEDYYCFDLIVHRWDIAKATGGDTVIDEGELDFVRAKVALYGDAARMPGVFAAELEAPPGADEQTRLLAFTGRQA